MAAPTPGDKRYWLDDAALSVLQEMVQDYRARRASASPARANAPAPPLPGAPEVYLARTPGTGVPALDVGAMTGTGTGTEWTDDVPGSAECDVYRVINGLPAKVPTLKKRVYNLTGVALAPGVWVLIIRDKFGTWFAPALGLEFTEC